MKSLDALLLLDVINSKGTLEALLQRGFTYTQISLLVDEAEKEGLVDSDIRGELRLTSHGHEFMARQQAKRKAGVGFIAPETSSRVPKLDRKGIYVPNPRRSSFFRERSG